jgi:hypothetical protein
MSTIRACHGLGAILLSLAVMAAPAIARDDTKAPPSGRDKGVERKAPTAAPKARNDKGRTETVDKDETITIHGKSGDRRR